jgi:hypothetical protein
MENGERRREKDVQRMKIIEGKRERRERKRNKKRMANEKMVTGKGGKVAHEMGER